MHKFTTGPGKRVDYTLVGRTANLASRFSAVVKAKEVLIDVETLRKIDGKFTVEKLKPAAVKGIGELVVMWRIGE